VQTGGVARLEAPQAQPFREERREGVAGFRHVVPVAVLVVRF
jgi:hypothetical protein